MTQIYTIMMNEQVMNVDINRIQYLSIFGSMILLAFILALIRNKKIKEEYSLLWIIAGVIFLFFAIWRDALDYLANLAGIAYAPAAIFLVFFIAIFIILVQFSIILSKLTEQNKRLIQEIGLLKMEIEQLKEK
ncbi:MAG: DUF2304 domain-containing protein [Bacteroidetes bacterium]|nr:DUF2304 domain-containing protein [Bacteroidota bacterium]